MSRRGKRRKAKRRQERATDRLSPTIDVVIPIYGEWGWLEECLDALDAARGKHPIKVILVDDCHPDGSKIQDFDLAPWREKFGRIGWARNKRNLGFPASCNRGAEMGNGFLILFLNTDVVLYPGAISHMAEMFADPGVGVVGAKLVFPEESLDPNRPAGQIQHAGLAVGFDGNPFHIFIGWPPDHPRVNKVREMQMVTGACMMTKRILWREIGGFELSYGKGTFEDTEYCVRARMARQRVMFQPAAMGTHSVGASVMGAKENYNVNDNRLVFTVRCGQFIFWDEWRFW